MIEENEIKQRIITKADQMFRQYGYSKVTMEEIAADLSISKKTLYKYFSNKEHILKEILHSNKCEVDKFIEELICNPSMPFIDKLQSFLNFIAKQASKLEGPMVRDLMRNQPQIWNDIDEFRKKKAYKHLSLLIEEGKKNGIFRDDMHTEVVIIAYMAAIHSLINPETLAKLPVSADQAYKDVIKILFQGIFTSEGRKKYKSITKENFGEVTV
jgi:AcrR family transcriptional regulator